MDGLAAPFMSSCVLVSHAYFKPHLHLYHAEAPPTATAAATSGHGRRQEGGADVLCSGRLSTGLGA